MTCTIPTVLLSDWPAPDYKRLPVRRFHEHLHPSMSVTDHHFRREDREVLWRRIARHIEAHPEDLAIALENLDRWESLGRVHPGPIHEWRGRILAARESREHMRAFIDFLVAPNHDSEPLKSCSPFVGVPLPETNSPDPA